MSLLESAGRAGAAASLLVAAGTLAAALVGGSLDGSLVEIATFLAVEALYVFAAVLIVGIPTHFFLRLLGTTTSRTYTVVGAGWGGALSAVLFLTARSLPWTVVMVALFAFAGAVAGLLFHRYSHAATP